MRLCPYARPSVRPVRLFVRACVCLSVRLPVCPYAYWSVRPARPFVRPSVKPVRPCVRPFIRPSVRLFVRPSVFSSVRPADRHVHPSIRGAMEITVFEICRHANTKLNDGAKPKTSRLRLCRAIEITVFELCPHAITKLNDGTKTQNMEKNELARNLHTTYPVSMFVFYLTHRPRPRKV